MLSSRQMPTSLLLADDSPTIAKILSMALQSEGYAIRSVLNANDAISELKNNPPFFFLVDLTLPEKDGFTLAKFVRSEPKLKNTKVVFLTSAFDPVDQGAIAAANVDLVIAKPFDPADLRAKLRQVRDAPPKFAGGGSVTGSLSGTIIQAAESIAPVTLPPAEMAPASGADDLLLGSGEADGDANSILQGLLGSDDVASPPAGSLPKITPTAAIATSPNTDQPPPFVHTPAPTDSDPLGPAHPTAMLDLNEMDLPADAKPEPKGKTPVLDLTRTFQEPPKDLDREIPSALHRDPAKAAAADPSLSPNAQALAAFFDAEIDAHVPEERSHDVPVLDLMAEADAFDASLSSIEWASSPAPADKNLNAWSSAAPSTPPAAAPSALPDASLDLPPAFNLPASFDPPTTFDEPPPAPKPASQAKPAPARPAPSSATNAPARRTDGRGTGAESGGSFLFDTGGSNFRFAEDYVNRITKSFTGNTNEEVPVHHAPEAPVFPRSSNDGKSAPSPGGWSPTDRAMMEKLIREEVQMAVREVLEKVAWEVIPELAENLIKKELDKVLKQMES